MHQVAVALCRDARFQQVATEYEQIKSAGIDPQVAELAEYHGLGGHAGMQHQYHCVPVSAASLAMSSCAPADERATRALDEEMKRRRDTQRGSI